MSVIDRLGDLLDMGGSDLDVYVYDCGECGASLESAKDPDRASCPECLSTDVQRTRSAD